MHWTKVLCFLLLFLFFQETYLMKHMSKHTMVEHLISHHSPQHRTESPTIPIRISLIWVSPPAPSLQRLFICAQPEDFEPTDGFGKVPDCTSVLRKDALLTNTLTFQLLLTWTSKDDITALLDGNRPQNSPDPTPSMPPHVTPQEEKVLWAATLEVFLLEQTTRLAFTRFSEPFFCSSLDKQKLFAPEIVSH